MIRRPPRSTQSRSSAASDVYKRQPPHDRLAVRRVPGIEVSVEDHDLMEVHSLEPEVDPRVVSIRVAGPVALMVAKAFKIRDRMASGRPERLSNKDASDVYLSLIHI